MNFCTLDFSKIASETDMTYDDIVHLMTIYEKELRSDLGKLQDHYVSNNLEGMLQVLHKIKGDSSNIALVDLESLTRTIESEAKQNRLNAFQDQLDQLKAFQKYFSDCVQELTQENTDN